MKLIIKKVRKKIAEVRRYHSAVRFYRASVPAIFIDLRNRTKVRTYLNLIVLIRKEYPETPIVIQFSLFRYFLLARWFAHFPNLHFSVPLKNRNILREFSSNKTKDFKIDFNYDSVYQSDMFLPNVIPYIMHPQNYLQDTNQVYPQQLCGILLSGNFNPEIYDNPIMQQKFGLENRYQLYEKVKKHPDTLVLTGDEFVEGLDAGKFLKHTVIMSWSGGAIPSAKWRYYLSSAKFIFCAPGMTMPLCHNVIEALSVGTVPIINYANWLNPSLEDEKNCLIYNDDVEAVLEKALRMDEASYQKLRNNAIEYYRSYYSGFNFEAFVGSTLTMVNEHSADLPKIST